MAGMKNAFNSRSDFFQLEMVLQSDEEKAKNNPQNGIADPFLKWNSSPNLTYLEWQKKKKDLEGIPGVNLQIVPSMTFGLVTRVLQRGEVSSSFCVL